MNSPTLQSHHTGTNGAETSVQIPKIFEQQKAFHPQIANTTAKERIQKLKQLHKAIEANRDAIYRALNADFRKSEAETDLTEIMQVVGEIRYAIRHLKKWLKPHRVAPTLVALTTRSWIRYEPRGVVLVISPWNYPFNLTLGPVVSAIAAGNCIMVKPSEFTPQTNAVVRKILGEVFPENEIAVIEGDATVATELLKLPFDHIFFTGNPNVGKIVMKAASENLASVTLELGGKSPVIIDESANINDAAKKVVWGKYLNMGQTCVAPDYVLVNSKVFPEFLEKVQHYIAKLYGETEAERKANNSYPRVISQRHHERLVELIRDAVENGATLAAGGQSDAAEKYISPTVLTDVSPDSRVMQEEIFGPVLPILSFDHLEAATATIAKLEKPLALYIFSRNRKNTDYFLNQTTSGGTCINDVALQFSHLNLPFGGVNHSGIGSSHGFFGFKAFSHGRAVLKHFSNTPITLLFPPYTGTVKKLIRLVEKVL